MESVFEVLTNYILHAGTIALFLGVCRMGISMLYRAFTGKADFI